MVIRYRLSPRTSSSTFYTRYDAQLLSWPIRRYYASDFHFSSLADHTVLSTITAK
jgi:hypothetical protein